MRVHTIGFTKSSAQSFFTRLVGAGVERVVDVRLRNASQLAGFAKQDDLRYFLHAIGGIDYVHEPTLAPTPQLLDAIQRGTIEWPEYERRFRALIAERAIERVVARATIDGACLLCSEAEPERCHRRLVAEHLRDAWGDLEIRHL